MTDKHIEEIEARRAAQNTDFALIDIDYLLAELRARDAEIERLRGVNGRLQTIRENSRAIIESMEAQIKALGGEP